MPLNSKTQLSGLIIIILMRGQGGPLKFYINLCLNYLQIITYTWGTLFYSSLSFVKLIRVLSFCYFRIAPIFVTGLKKPIIFIMILDSISVKTFLEQVMEAYSMEAELGPTSSKRMIYYYSDSLYKYSNSTVIIIFFCCNA